MYIKMTKNQAGQAYYHLVESYRGGVKVRQRTLLALGRVGEDRMDELIAALSRYREIMRILEMAKAVSVEETYFFVADRGLFSAANLEHIRQESRRGYADLNQIPEMPVMCSPSQTLARIRRSSNGPITPVVDKR